MFGQLVAFLLNFLLARHFSQVKMNMKCFVWSLKCSISTKIYPMTCNNIFARRTYSHLSNCPCGKVNMTTRIRSSTDSRVLQAKRLFHSQKTASGSMQRNAHLPNNFFNMNIFTISKTNSMTKSSPWFFTISRLWIRRQVSHQQPLHNLNSARIFSEALQCKVTSYLFRADIMNLQCQSIHSIQFNVLTILIMQIANLVHPRKCNY